MLVFWMFLFILCFVFTKDIIHSRTLDCPRWSLQSTSLNLSFLSAFLCSADDFIDCLEGQNTQPEVISTFWLQPAKGGLKTIARWFRAKGVGMREKRRVEYLFLVLFCFCHVSPEPMQCSFYYSRSLRAKTASAREWYPAKLGKRQERKVKMASEFSQMQEQHWKNKHWEIRIDSAAPHLRQDSWFAFETFYQRKTHNCLTLHGTVTFCPCGVWVCLRINRFADSCVRNITIIHLLGEK